ncbi:MAG: DNA-binding response regulator [Planctomycetia bacterium]|nr:DNA-binding response regulator [Planctomycetia bacterium]
MRRFLPALLAAAAITPGLPAGEPRLDPYAQAVVDSVAHPPPATPRQLLDAAARTAAVEAGVACAAYARQLAEALDQAGDGRPRALAELGAAADPADLTTIETLLAGRAPELVPVVAAIRAAARAADRDPERLARAAADLSSASSATRAAAATTLGRAGLDGLPALVGVLGSDDANGPAGDVARALVRGLGADARRELLGQLASADVRTWPGVIAALSALPDDDLGEFLLAPALVSDTPPEIRDRALAALRTLAGRCPGGAGDRRPPTRAEAVARIVARLDRTLASPQPDVATALHLARDLMALGATGPDAVRLVLLTRLVALAGSGPADVPPERLAGALAGPDGVDLGTAAAVLDLAASRGLFAAAALAARGLEEAVLPPGRPLDEAPEPPLPPAAREALVRALAVPDAAVQFAAAHALALAGGRPPFPGSSRVVETLAHAATATGGDRAVVAHHDDAVAHEIATGLSRFGYRPTVVSTGRAAVRVAREHADTVLVVLGARIVLPPAAETVQFIHEQPHGDIPPVLVVVDPLDDEARGRFLTKSILTFTGLPCVALVDRMESFFRPVVDPETGRELAPARFPEALERLAGPQAGAAELRAARAAVRLERARQAGAIVALLPRPPRARRGTSGVDGVQSTRVHAPAPSRRRCCAPRVNPVTTPLHRSRG